MSAFPAPKTTAAWRVLFFALLAGVGAQEIPNDRRPATLTGPAVAVATQTPDTADTASDGSVPVQLPPSLAEIVKLYQEDVGTGLIVNFIEDSPVAYRLTADQVIYFHRLGVPSEISTALLRHGSELRARWAEASRGASQPRVAAAAPRPMPIYPYSPPTPQPIYDSYTYWYPAISYVGYPIYGYVYPWNYSYLYSRIHGSFVFRQPFGSFQFLNTFHFNPTPQYYPWAAGLFPGSGFPHSSAGRISTPPHAAHRPMKTSSVRR